VPVFPASAWLKKPFHERSAFTVIPDSCYRESILGFPLQQLLEHGARGEPILVSKGLLVLPGFAPANEVLLGASRRARPLLWRQKWPKPITPRQASFDGTDANLRRAGQLAALRQGPPDDLSVRPRAGRKASDLGKVCKSGSLAVVSIEVLLLPRFVSEDQTIIGIPWPCGEAKSCSRIRRKARIV
jgi:hypothetical protein